MSESLFPPKQLHSTYDSHRAEGTTYKCRGRGALLSLPNGGHREDIIRTKAFEDYIRDNVVSWFTWAQRNKLGVERMEDLILVTGCTLVTSWAIAVFMDNNIIEPEISLASIVRNNGCASFIWSGIHGPVLYRNSHFDSVRSTGYVYSASTDFFFLYGKQESVMIPDQCIFIRGFRAKRTSFGIRVLRYGVILGGTENRQRTSQRTQRSRFPNVRKVGYPLL